MIERNTADDMVDNLVENMVDTMLVETRVPLMVNKPLIIIDHNKNYFAVMNFETNTWQHAKRPLLDRHAQRRSWLPWGC